MVFSEQFQERDPIQFRAPLSAVQQFFVLPIFVRVYFLGNHAQERV